jgi:hypothetical protein
MDYIPKYYNVHAGQVAILSDYPLPCIIERVGIRVDGIPYIGISTISSIFEYGRSFDLDGNDFHSPAKIVKVFDIDKEFVIRVDFLQKQLDKVLTEAEKNGIYLRKRK